jgi:hypothetical protein
MVTRFADAGSSVRWGWIVGVAVIVSGTWWALRRSRQSAVDWALLLTAMLVISPLGWVYYGLIPALPAAAVMLERHQRMAPKLLAAVFAIPPVVVVLLAERMSSAVASALINSTYAIALTFAWLVLAMGHPALEPSITDHV